MSGPNAPTLWLRCAYALSGNGNQASRLHLSGPPLNQVVDADENARFIYRSMLAYAEFDVHDERVRQRIDVERPDREESLQ